MAATAPQALIALRNVLIATDFSPCSERALMHAVSVAHHFHSTLHLAHVIQPSKFSLVPPDAYMGSSEATCMAVDLARVDAEKNIARVLRRSGCDDIQHRTWIPIGGVAEMVRSIIDREHIGLAVVGTHGRTGFRRLVLGSVAEEVFRHASCPVLTVGPHSWRSDPQSIRLRRILFPTDLTPESLSALPFVKAIAAEFGAGITMLHTIERLDAEAQHDCLRVVAALEDRMREMVVISGSLPVSFDYQVKFGDIADTVIDAAGRLEIDLVAFGLKAPNTYADRLPWMHAYKMVCEVPCPVLSLRSASS